MSAEVPATHGTGEPRPLRLLFLCVENSNRSQMAEALARLRGGARVEAWSAGSHPSGQVNPRAVAAMSELGYDLGTHRSKGLDGLPDLTFDVAVTMGCGDACPAVGRGRARMHEAWEIPDPRALPLDGLRAVRDTIDRCIGDLLARHGVR